MLATHAFSEELASKLTTIFIGFITTDILATCVFENAVLQCILNLVLYNKIKYIVSALASFMVLLKNKN